MALNQCGPFTLTNSCSTHIHARTHYIRTFVRTCLHGPYSHWFLWKTMTNVLHKSSKTSCEKEKQQPSKEKEKVSAEQRVVREREKEKLVKQIWKCQAITTKRCIQCVCICFLCFAYECMCGALNEWSCSAPPCPFAQQQQQQQQKRQQHRFSHKKWTIA